jgi:hypothetical protein
MCMWQIKFDLSNKCVIHLTKQVLDISHLGNISPKNPSSDWAIVTSHPMGMTSHSTHLDSSQRPWLPALLILHPHIASNVKLSGVGRPRPPWKRRAGVLLDHCGQHLTVEMMRTVYDRKARHHNRSADLDLTPRPCSGQGNRTPWHTELPPHNKHIVSLGIYLTVLSQWGIVLLKIESSIPFMQSQPQHHYHYFNMIFPVPHISTHSTVAICKEWLTGSYLPLHCLWTLMDRHWLGLP